MKNTNHKKVEMVILISDNIDIKTRKMMDIL